MARPPERSGALGVPASDGEGGPAGRSPRLEGDTDALDRTAAECF
jgi:hypothetical protein